MLVSKLYAYTKINVDDDDNIGRYRPMYEYTSEMTSNFIAIEDHEVVLRPR